MGLRISRRPFLYSSHLIIEVLDKRKCTGLPIPIFHKAEAAFICANNTFLIVSYRTLDEAVEKYPIVLALHEADLEASKLMEDKNDNKALQTELITT